MKAPGLDFSEVSANSPIVIVLPPLCFTDRVDLNDTRCSAASIFLRRLRHASTANKVKYGGKAALARTHFRLIVDAGCGSGRPTLALALRTLIHAVDVYEPFLDYLARRAEAQQVREFVQTHCMNMKDIPRGFRSIDLLSSGGAAYNIGFANALSVWAPAIAPGGFAVVSGLCWIKQETAPAAVCDFFRTGY